MAGKIRYLLLSMCLGLGLLLVMVHTLASSAGVALAQAGTGAIRVATTGSDAPGCGGEANPCQTVQYAVGQALPGEEIHVAGGTYSGVNQYGGHPQVVYLDKDLTIRGGYSPSDWSTPDPVANPTTLDAQGQGRVLYLTAGISVTIEGLRIVGGNARLLGGDPWEATRGVGYMSSGLRSRSATVSSKTTSALPLETVRVVV
jgi:hypothetical protein